MKVAGLNNYQLKNNKILSLFSGGGFLDIGFMNEGFQISEAIENTNDFVKAYNEGISSYVKKSQKKIFVEKIVTHINIESPQDASNVTLQNKLRKTHNGITGIIGGPPCQDFSVAGLNRGAEGDRGKLIFTYLDIVKKIKPSFIFFENVPGLININHRVGFFELLEELNKDYQVWYEVLNPLDLGMPQDRPRLALVGFKKNLVKKLLKAGYKFLLEKTDADPDDLIFRWPKKKFLKPKAIEWPRTWNVGESVIQSDIDKIPEEYKCLTVGNAFIGLNEKTPNQQEHFIPYSDRFNHLLEGDTSKKSYKKLHRYRYSPTVAYGNNEVHIHPTEKRRLTVREALRLQTVSDNYVLPKDMSLSSKFKIIGNGVPSKKAELIAKEIKRTLELYESIV